MQFYVSKGKLSKIKNKKNLKELKKSHILGGNVPPKNRAKKSLYYMKLSIKH